MKEFSFLNDSGEPTLDKETLYRQEIEDQAHFINGIATAITDIILIIEIPSRKLVYFNHNPALLLGSETDGVSTLNKEKYLTYRVHPDDMHIANEFYSDLEKLVDGKMAEVECRFLGNEGIYCYHLKGRPFRRNDSGALSQALVIASDISERKTKEKELLRLKDELSQKPGENYSGLFNGIENGFGKTAFIRNSADGNGPDLLLSQGEQTKSFVLKLSDLLHPQADAIKVQEIAARLLGEYLNADRTYYAFVDGDNEIAMIEREYVRGNAASVVGMHPFNDSVLAVEAYRTGKLSVINDVDNSHPVPKADLLAYRALSVRSLVTIPILKDCKVVAGMSVLKAAPHNWTKDEIALIVDTGERTWAAVERARAERALHTTENRIRIQKEAFQSAINGEPLENALKILTRIVKEEMGTDVRTAFYLASPGHERMYAIEGAGDMPESYTTAVEVAATGGIAFGSPLPIATDQPVVTADIFKDPQWESFIHLAKQYNFRSCGFYPILTTEHRAIGSFGVYFAGAREQTRQDVAVTEVITQAAAIIISRNMEIQEHARIEDALRKSENDIKQLNSSLGRQVKERTNELEESRHLLQSVFDAVPSSIAVFKIICNEYNKAEDFEIVMFNECTYKTLKTTPDVVGNKYSEMSPLGQEVGVTMKLKEVADKGITLKFEHHYSGDGMSSWFCFNAAKIEDLLIVVTEDITEQKTAEVKIKEDEHFIGHIMDTTPDIIYIMDLNTRQMIYANRQVAADLGYTKQQIDAMKNPMLDLLHDEDWPAMGEHLKKMKTMAKDDQVIEIEYRLINAKGGVTWFLDRNSVFNRNRRNTPIERIGIARNITERKLQEQQILTGLEIMEQTEEIAAMGSWEYDIATAGFKWSEGMYRLFNLPANVKVTPHTYFDYTPQEELAAVSAIVGNIEDRFVSFEEIITLLPENQDKKVVKIKAVVIRDEKNNPVKMIGVDLDITLQLAAAGKINDLNKMLEAKNKDLHELNNELRTFNTVASRDYKETIQTLYTNLEYIVTKEARNLSDTAKANIRRGQAAIQKMKLLTEDINAYLRLYDLGINKSLIDPNNIVDNIISAMKEKLEQAGATIEKTELPEVYADPLLFSFLVRSLIDNAVKFRKLAIPLIIKIRHALADEMNTVSAAIKDMPYVIISISDNGIGFAEDDAEKIFELFVRLQDKGKHRGSGIGLAACKKIMAMHNGFISAEGVPGAGSSFSCYFPQQKT